MESKEYKCSFSCGPTLIEPQSLHIYSQQYSYSDNDPDFLNLYENTQKLIKSLLNIEDYEVFLQSGSSIVSIWGSFKSILKPKDKVVVLKTGYYSTRLFEILNSLEFDVKSLEFDIESSNFGDLRKLVSDFHPKMIVATHCETASGFILPVVEIGKISREFNSLLFVDFISTFGAMELPFRDWNIDIGIFGTHKALNLPPDLGISVVGQRVLDLIEENQYQGYDSLYLLSNSLKRNQFPYSFNWRSISALNVRIHQIEKNKKEIYDQHIEISKKIRSNLKEMGLKLLTENERLFSPVVTVVKLPEKVSWNDLNNKLKEKGVLFSSGKGELHGKVMRIGHMGIQCNLELLLSSLQILETVLKDNYEEFFINK